ncbi:MAG: hypothetical protein PHY93_05285 [Bacteriovorax sp.]|nr:hypothetical protein [Bacteriovorax sp.]
MLRITIQLMALMTFYVLSAYAQNNSKIIAPNDLKMIEDKVQSELKSPVLSDDKKFLINIIAGRELYQYRFYDKSQIYYENALKINTSENKTEALVNLIAIAINKSDKEKVRSLYEEAQNYYEKKSAFKTRDIDYYLNAVANYLSDKKAKQIDGFYATFAREEDLINLLKNKEYQKAFISINPAGLKKSTNNFNITVYDSLNVLMNKKGVKELNCATEYKKYPKAYTYSIIICGLLTDYLESGKFSDKKMKRATSYFLNDNPEKNYLFELVKEIKK